jgi:exonuclease III
MWNANGLMNKRSEFITLLDDQKPDIVAISEAKMSESQAGILFEFKEKGYFPYYKMRNEDGGGVILLVKDNIKNNKQTIFTDDEKKKFGLDKEEIVGIETKIEGKYYYIYCLYNPPEKPINPNVFKYLETKKDYILLGDLNCRLEQIDGKTNANGRKLSEILETSRCLLLNEKNKPTFFENRKDRQPYKSTLDLVFSSYNVEKSKRASTLCPSLQSPNIKRRNTTFQLLSNLQ